MKIRVGDSKGSLDTFHYSRTFFCLVFELACGKQVFSDGIRKIIEKTLLGDSLL
jgi:hypothetical protein